MEVNEKILNETLEEIKNEQLNILLENYTFFNKVAQLIDSGKIIIFSSNNIKSILKAYDMELRKYFSENSTEKNTQKPN